MIRNPKSAIVILCALFFLPHASQAQQLSNPDSIAAHGKSFVEALSTYRFSEVIPLFDSMMASMVDTTSLAQTWNGLIVKAGIFQGITGVRVDSQAGYHIAYVTCRFDKGELNLKVVYNKIGRVAGFFFEPTHPPAVYKMPSYVKPDSIREKLVSIGKSPWLLHGALSEPNNGKKLPAIILVHGSGPLDRDETVGKNKPFRDLAFGLATRGIAVFRYDKRTFELSADLEPLKDSITVKEETIDDALAAVKRLRGREEIDSTKIFILGHSLGGMLAPRIATLDTTIAGLIIMAGTTRPLEDVIVDQMEYLNSGTAKSNDSAQAMLSALRKQAALVKSPQLNKSTPTSMLPLGSSAAYWLALRGYEPAAVAATIHKPMLILQGERDYQVTAKDYALWNKALSSRKDVTFKSYPGLNHLFVEGTKKSTPVEYELEGHVSERVIEDIAAWIKAIR